MKQTEEKVKGGRKRKPLRKEYAMYKDIYDRSDDIEKTVERIEFLQAVQQAREANKRKDDRNDR